MLFGCPRVYVSSALVAQGGVMEDFGCSWKCWTRFAANRATEEVLRAGRSNQRARPAASREVARPSKEKRRRLAQRCPPAPVSAHHREEARASFGSDCCRRTISINVISAGCL